MEMEEKEPRKRRLTLLLARSAIMAALVAVATFIVQIPNPATKGYFNIGDIMIFVSALTFGPIVGGFAGSVGSAISDVAGGYGYFAPFTFVIKGVEGIIAGLISNRSSGAERCNCRGCGGFGDDSGIFFYGSLSVWRALCINRSAREHFSNSGWRIGRDSFGCGFAEETSRSLDKVEPCLLLPALTLPIA